MTEQLNTAAEQEAFERWLSALNKTLVSAGSRRLSGNEVGAAWGAWMARTRAALSNTVNEQDAIDAARWRALLNSARVRPLGSAGLSSELDPCGKPWNGYAHLGLELWTQYGGLNDDQLERMKKENALGRDWLTRYADIAALTQATDTQGVKE